MKRKVLIGILVFVMVATIITGCGTSGATGQGATDKSVKDKVVIAVPADMSSFDPQYTSAANDEFMCCNIYDCLVTMDESGKIVPELAESWTISEDGTAYTFKLKKGVKWHNGEEFKASDVVYTVNRAKESPYLAQNASIMKDAVAIDDYTVQINLVIPFSPFITAMNGFYIVNEKAIKEAGDKYGQQPIGTGPYKFVSREKGQKIILERFDDYYQGPAPIKNIEFKVITDNNTSLIALQSGEIDFMLNLPMSSSGLVNNDKNLTTYKFDAITVYFLAMNNAVKPFNNIKVRQAISYAIDKASIVKIVEEGMGTVDQSFFSKNQFGYSENVKGHEFNTAKAKEILTQAGYPNGFKLTLKTVEGTLSKTAQVIQANLKDIGITANIEILEKSAFDKDTINGNYEMCMSAMTLPADADFWQIVFGTTGGYNFTKYSNAKVDELFAQGRATVDSAKRLEIYEQIANLMNEDSPAIPLYSPTRIYVGNKNLNIGYIQTSGMTKVFEMSWAK